MKLTKAEEIHKTIKDIHKIYQQYRVIMALVMQSAINQKVPMKSEKKGLIAKTKGSKFHNIFITTHNSN